eukprot:Selendium_serpulae@DN1417_c0_g1_i3.p1
MRLSGVAVHTSLRHTGTSQRLDDADEGNHDPDEDADDDHDEDDVGRGGAAEETRPRAAARGATRTVARSVDETTVIAGLARSVWQRERERERESQASQSVE